MKKVAEGLQILLKYDPDGGCCAEHDEFYAGNDCPPEKMTPEDVARLDELGWLWDADLPSWMKFV